MNLYFRLFWAFFKIGAFTFGGGYAMIPLIQREVVDRKKWLEEDEFIDMLAIAQSVPGPISLNTAVFVGNKMRGIKGSLISGLGIILPSFIVILLIALVFTEFKDNPGVERVFKGIRPAVVALIAAPLWNMGKKAGITWRTLWIPVAAALLIWLAGISPVYIVMVAIAGGIGWYMLQLKKRK
ncbi:chromate transporter [Culturomica massiliensis]|jgi:chromate transporter|uniref:chromate transporter n=1 Tax=Culturomica massiliensis TaxID=1841857 RepID=UPI000340D8FD|nr:MULTISPECIES: chromate transporter [Odoribacteraceae]RHV96613.1 chromate transporter [Odoribacter sp. OF09-27XD]CCZ07512.1 chromate ion transporter (CHR) family chromate transporter [Odoribacter sp. CAG:788]